jgi:curli biogenesis system outer membrane secretion channel CsgG
MKIGKKMIQPHCAFAICGVAIGIAALLTGCATSPSLGSGGTVATGGAGGATSEGASEKLERCAESLGTIAVDEDERAPWFARLRSANLGSTTPVLRMIIQQSNCFVVVERGRAMNNMMRERALAGSGEMRQDSNMGRGQMVAADFTMSPSVTISERGTQGAGIALGGLGLPGRIAGAAAGSFRANEASTMLLMVDNRSGVQLAAAAGSAKNFDFGVFGAAFGSGAGALGGGYSNTPQGKVLVASFMDSYNNLVRSTRNYVAQNVRGGLGTGGRLGVQGGSTPASRELESPKAPAR